MPRWFYALLLGVPAALVARLLALPDLVVFTLSVLSLIPLAGLVGKATEDLAHHLGPRIGGLLNATFGNAPELIITLFAVQRGLLTLVKASITGSIIGNTLLVLGFALLAGGVKHGRPGFDPRHTSLDAALMILAVAGLYLPAIFALTARDQAAVEGLSLRVAGVLLLTYLAYLAYTMRHGKPTGDEAGRGEPSAAPDEADGWSVGVALLVLAATMVGLAISSELLVATVEAVTRQLGWSEFFVGVIIVPVAGNVAEHFSAVQMAWRNRLDVSFAIAAGSSTQVALLVAPTLAFASLALGHPMDLIFRPLELAILGLATAIFAYLSLDGEANWLEGVQLLALYVLAGLAFFSLPNGPP